MQEAITCIVVRVSRPDTVIVRTYCPQVQSMLNIHLVLEGIRPLPHATRMIEEWCDIHGENERLKLLTWQWVRDQYGRVLGDLGDISSGETLTDYLIEAGAAMSWTDHYIDIVRENEQF